MAEVLIETKAPSEITTPTTGYVELFYDSTNNNRLSYMDSSRNVVVLQGGSGQNEETAGDVQEQFWSSVTCALNSGMITAEQFSDIVNAGFNVSAGTVTDDAGNSTTTINSGAILVPIVSVTITPDPVPNIDLSSSPTSDLSAAVLPVTANQTIIWVSSDPSVATVDNVGTVTGVSAGTATIYAYAAADLTKFDSVSVTVVP